LTHMDGEGLAPIRGSTIKENPYGLLIPRLHILERGFIHRGLRLTILLLRQGELSLTMAH
jgi:hypothetical protein